MFYFDYLPIEEPDEQEGESGHLKIVLPIVVVAVVVIVGGILLLYFKYVIYKIMIRITRDELKIKLVTD